MTETYPPQPPVATGLRGCCPRCGEGRLFSGFIKVAPACNVCGLDLNFAEQADGPAVFVMLFGGFVVAGFALWLETDYEPPFWVHFVTTLPLLLIVCVGLLRPLKGVLIALQYANKAEEGRLER
jgi:uncharacterized protein (DUF983 family)